MNLDEEVPERHHPAMPVSTAFGLRGLARDGLNIDVGRYSYGVPQVAWARGDLKRKLTIGSFCSIAANVTIYVGFQGRHTTDFLSTYPMGMVFGRPAASAVSSALKGNLDVEIGSDVWIGRDVMVLAGCKIGHGACVGARSLVTSDVAPYAIVGGSPAKVIRRRFDPEIIAKLLAIQWWDWPDDRIRANMQLFNTDDIAKVIDAIGSQ